MRLHKALAQLHTMADDGIRRYLAHERDKNGYRSPCRAGCAACCRQQVTADLADAMAILCYLERHNLAAIPPLIAACIPLAQKLAEPGMDSTAYARLQLPCPLLKNELCSVYTVRPTICQAHVSLDQRAKCYQPGSVIRQLPAAEINAKMLPRYTQLLEQANMPNPVGPLPYMLLVAQFIREQPDEGWRRLAHTPALDQALACGAWLHLEAFRPDFDAKRHQVQQRLGLIPKPYPIWNELAASPGARAP